MTTDLFQFRHRPYSAASNVANYVPFESIEGAIDSVMNNVRRGAGTAVVIGAAGLGKTMLCQVLAKRLADSHEVVMLATSSLCTRRALLQNVLFELGLPYRDRDEGELRLGLLDHLRSKHNTSSGMVMLVDEAQTMPLRLLEEVRVLANITRDGKARVHLVFAGNQSFDERLNQPKLDAIQQRISTRSYLFPMNREETARFIARQWTQSSPSNEASPFSTEALRRVHEASEGIPRLINQICDHALMLANARRLRQVSDELIQEAWSDLQQLPTPWQVNHRDTPLTLGQATPTIIEFGSLDDSRPWSGSNHDDQERTETRAISRLEEVDRMTQDAFDEELPSIEVGAETHHDPAPVTPPQATRIVDPFADSEFEQEEWITTPAKSALISTAIATKPVDDEPLTSPAESQSTAEPRLESTSEVSSSFQPFEGPIEAEADEVERPDPQFVFNQDEAVVDPFASSEEFEEEITVEPASAAPVFPPRLSKSLEPSNSMIDAPTSNSSLASQSTQEAPTLDSPLPPDEVKGLLSNPGDDRDLILIDDPVPPSNLRVVSAPLSGLENRGSSTPMGTAYREDYRSLFTRLRGESQREA